MLSITGDRHLVWVLLAVLLLSAYANAFIQDDAFISFRYARNLVTDHELIWNVGSEERVEGYTNFLWVLMMAAAIGLGMDPVPVSQALGLAFAFGTLLLSYRLSVLLFHASGPALLAMTLLGTNYTFSAYATGGLETQMQTCLIVAGTYVALGIHEGHRSPIAGGVLLSTLAALAMLTRLDSAIPFLVLLGFALWSHRRGPHRGGSSLVIMASLGGPLIAIVLPWLWWKLYYYADILPNTYYVKASNFSLEVLWQGLRYIYEFMRSYMLLPLVLIGAVMFRSLQPHTPLRLFALLIACWCAYVIKVGGDFMEFRLLVPILPLLFILIVRTILSLADARVRVALVALILIGSLQHASSYRVVHRIASIAQLKANIVVRQWDEVGRSLEALFSGGVPPVTIATTAAGAIPYYSELPTVDMHGLNDRWIARNGVVWSTWPGHQRLAPLRYLVERGVNLVIGHPLVKPSTEEALPAELDDGIKGFRIAAVERELTPEPARVIEIPLGSGLKIAILYLIPHPRVDRAIREHELVVRYLP